MYIMCVYVCMYACVVTDSDRVFPKVRKVHVGQDANFICHGRTRELLRWMRYDRVLPAEYHNKYLQLVNVTIEDYGEYKCIGYKHGHTGISFSAIAYLKVIGKFLVLLFWLQYYVYYMYII